MEKKENVNTALFTAGIAVLVVCLKRALLLFLVQQWRAWVFVVLNLVLLAIFFTSMNPNSTQISHQEITTKNDHEEMKKKKTKRGNLNEVEACKEDDHEVIKPKKRSKSEEDEELVIEEEEEENIEPLKLSKEELTERVEAFIVMFRQHLALDARKGRKQDDFKENKKHINLSSQGVNCIVLKV